MPKNRPLAAGIVKFACLLLLLLPLASRPVRAADTGAAGQTWETETLTNGLRIIYAPMPTSPATHVRVLYHVGSRDERIDRQGFAHMFEHMMFRGSAHVQPQEHMKLIGLVGGISNAFTSFDKTVYYQTLPANYNELALWLEADRMSSFKVSPQIFYTERLVVGEEWRMRMNQPYGTMWDELMPAIFKKHPYQWTPIGNMQHLQAATASELQDFFNHYYVPNNAILVIAGKIDVAQTKDQVHKYFGWIPGGTAPMLSPTDPAAKFGPLVRNIPVEPPQTEPRRLEVTMRVPLSRLVMAYRMPPNASDDEEPLGLLLSIVGDGQSSRLYRALVTTNDPLCVSAGALAWDLEDGGVMGYEATLLNGKDPAAVEKILRDQIALARDTLVTPEELEKVKQQERLALAQRFETAEKVATELGDEMLVRNNLDRIPTARARLEAITPADLQRVAKQYFGDNSSTTMVIRPGAPSAPATAAAGIATPPAPAAAIAAPAQPAANARTVTFPADYPTTPPMTGTLPAAVFDKGVEKLITLPNSSAPVRVIVMEDHRMPIINWSLALRAGGHSDPQGKDGLAGMTADMLQRGPKGKTFDQFNEDLESRAISLDVSDGGDTTRITGSCLKEQFPFALNATKEMLLTPAFDPGEFQRLKNQATDSLRLALHTPQTVAGRELGKALYGDTPLGRQQNLQTLAAITLDDVKQFFGQTYRLDNAILMISGDITVAEGQRAAENFLTGRPTGNLPKVDYTLPPPPKERRIILVDLPESKQSAIQIGIPAYSIHSDEKFAGSLAGQMLSSGIDSRLGKYVRAEKGYVYGVVAYFQPNRQAGAFAGETDTKFTTTADTLEAMFKVFDDLKAAPVPEKELADAKFRVAGQLVMSMETITDQTSQRINGILNDYPIDYYDKYAERIGKVTADEVKAVVNKYVNENQMVIVVVAPADSVKEQLARLGKVEIITPPAGE